MPLAIRDPNTVPPENWAYEVAGLSDRDRQIAPFTITTKNYTLLYPQIVDYCRSNQLPVPSPHEVIDQMCERLHINCYDTETHQPLINKMGLPFVSVQSNCCQPIPVAPAPEETI